MMRARIGVAVTRGKSNCACLTYARCVAEALL